MASFIRKRNCSANRFALAADSSCCEATLLFSNRFSPQLSIIVRKATASYS